MKKKEFFFFFCDNLNDLYLSAGKDIDEEAWCNE